MKILIQKSGFTLIEIIVVIIIVGILAAIAVPNFFSNIQKSRGGEALTSLGTYKTVMEGCLQIHVGTEQDNCNTGQITFASTANFNYSIAIPPTNGAPLYQLVANPTGINNLIVGTDEITLSRNSATGLIICSGVGALQGIC